MGGGPNVSGHPERARLRRSVTDAEERPGFAGALQTSSGLGVGGPWRGLPRQSICGNERVTTRTIGRLALSRIAVDERPLEHRVRVAAYLVLEHEQALVRVGIHDIG